MLSQNEITKFAQENRIYLEALEEFDRTGQLRKVHLKQRVNFTIDMDLMSLFRKDCQDKGVKMSTVVERLIKESLLKENAK